MKRAEFRAHYQRLYLRSGVRRRARGDRAARGDRLAELSQGPQGASHDQGRTRLRGSRVQAFGRMAQDARRLSAAEKRQKDPATQVPRACDRRARRATTGAAREKSPRHFAWSRRPRTSCAARGSKCDRLDLSLLTSDYARKIHPCKACVSTAMPLCHWPCSCYPNHALGEVNDWMAEIYERLSPRTA